MQATEDVARDLERQISEATRKVRAQVTLRMKGCQNPLINCSSLSYG
jgi:hypothetical protein